MASRFPTWIIVLLAMQMLLALLFLAFGWSMTASLAQGRPPAFADIALLASPALAVAICAVLSAMAWRGARQGLAKVLAFVPLPIAFVLFGLLGAI